MKKSEKEKQIPLNNYFVVAIMFIAVISFTLVLREWYRSYKDYQMSIPVISGKVQEITSQEFDNYIMEHDEFLLYIGSASDSNCRMVEKELVDVLEKREIINTVVYLNISDVNNKDEYLNGLVDKYMEDKRIISYPSFIIVYDKDFVDFVSKEESQNLRIDDIEKLLDIYEIGD